jgi:hypothetical protein
VYLMRKYARAGVESGPEEAPGALEGLPSLVGAQD